MDSFKKSYLVPKTVLDTMSIANKFNPDVAGVTQYITSLDNQIASVLNDKSLPPELKVLKYNDALARFSAVKGNVFNQPLRIYGEREKTQPAIKQDVKGEQQQQAAEHVGIAQLPDFSSLARGPGIGKSNTRTYAVLMNHLENNPQIKFNTQGNLIFEGKPIENSNVLDLLHYFTKKGGSRPPAQGHQQFAKLLRETNVPQAAIGNIIHFEDALSVSPVRELLLTPKKQPEDSSPYAEDIFKPAYKHQKSVEPTPPTPIKRGRPRIKRKQQKGLGFKNKNIFKNWKPLK